MKSSGRAVAWGCATALAMLALAVTSGAADAQKSGGILKIPHGDSPQFPRVPIRQVGGSVRPTLSVATGRSRHLLVAAHNLD
jgi:hypothetical protein